jgi:hypothetical protein
MTEIQEVGFTDWSNVYIILVKRTMLRKDWMPKTVLGDSGTIKNTLHL